jgi:protein required for attachment to host cells
MKDTCIVVTDARRARFFSAQRLDAPRGRLQLSELAILENPDPREPGADSTGRPATETNTDRQAGPVHPIGAQRERHHLEHARRFGQEIALKAGTHTSDWRSGRVVLIAGPHMLGLVRKHLRDALHKGIELQELAKDYGKLSAAEIVDHLPAALLQ